MLRPFWRRQRLAYLLLLAEAHQRLRPARYVEIGVSTGRSLAAARADTRAVGIDPDPQLQEEIACDAELVELTSDEYFATRDLSAELGGSFDLGFIDGLHLFEFALRDLIGLERHAGDRSILLIHDCLPVDELTQRRERATRFWSGDVWRLIVLLRRHRPDLEVEVLDVGPTGLGVVRGLDPASNVLSERYDELVRELLAYPYEQLVADGLERQLGVVAPSRRALRRLLRP